jgi:hypothetical protein
LLSTVCDDAYEAGMWTRYFDQVHEGVRHVWDQQWLYTCWANGGLAVLPDKNLIRNIGFARADATHTVGESPFMELPTEDIWEVRHPPFMVRNREADDYTLDTLFGRREARTVKRRLRAAAGSAKRKLYSLVKPA